MFSPKEMWINGLPVWRNRCPFPDSGFFPCQSGGVLKLEGTVKIILFTTFILHMWKLEIQKDRMTLPSCTQWQSIRAKTKPCVLTPQARGFLYSLMSEQTPRLYVNLQFCIIKNSKTYSHMAFGFYPLTCSKNLNK